MPKSKELSDEYLKGWADGKKEFKKIGCGKKGFAGLDCGKKDRIGNLILCPECSHKEWKKTQSEGCGKKEVVDGRWEVCTNSLTNEVINECRKEKWLSCIIKKLCPECQLLESGPVAKPEVINEMIKECQPSRSVGSQQESLIGIKEADDEMIQKEIAGTDTDFDTLKSKELHYLKIKKCKSHFFYPREDVKNFIRRVENRVKLSRENKDYGVYGMICRIIKEESGFSDE